jgi:mRNA interferase RelE/StbE
LIYRVKVSAQASSLVRAISDHRVQEKLLERMTALAHEPELQGKPLGDDLKGYRSVRAVGQRYRIIYRVERSVVTVAVVAAGIRKAGSREDIYEVARRLLKLGLL